MIRKMCVCVGFLKYVWVGACVVLCVEIISAILNTDPETEKGGEKNKSGGIQSSFRFWRSYKLTVNWILVTIFFTTLARNSKTNPKFNKIRKNKTTNNN